MVGTILQVLKYMTYKEEQELLELTRSNNLMLRQIIAYISIHGNHTDDVKEFMINVLANNLSKIL